MGTNIKEQYVSDYKEHLRTVIFMQKLLSICNNYADKMSQSLFDEFKSVIKKSTNMIVKEIGYWDGIDIQNILNISRKYMALMDFFKLLEEYIETQIEMTNEEKWFTIPLKKLKGYYQCTRNGDIRRTPNTCDKRKTVEKLKPYFMENGEKAFAFHTKDINTSYLWKTIEKATFKNNEKGE